MTRTKSDDRYLCTLIPEGRGGPPLRLRTLDGVAWFAYNAGLHGYDWFLVAGMPVSEGWRKQLQRAFSEGRAHFRQDHRDWT